MISSSSFLYRRDVSWLWSLIFPRCGLRCLSDASEPSAMVAKSHPSAFLGLQSAAHTAANSRFVCGCSAGCLMWLKKTKHIQAPILNPQNAGRTADARVSTHRPGVAHAVSDKAQAVARRIGLDRHPRRLRRCRTI